MAIEQGEIYWLLRAPDHVPPAIIVSREALNRGNYVVVAPVTTKKFEERSVLPNCLPLRAGQFGLSRDCVAQAEALQMVEIGELDLEKGPIGRLGPAALRDLVRAVGYMMGADCEPC